MFVIRYYAPSGRSFVHVGTEKGIRQLLAKELSGVRWEFLSKRKFSLKSAA